MTLRSAQFDDIYFSPEDGFAETRHVFVDNNGLPQAWAGRDRFVIAETGFGTGLNFLAAWEAFERTAGPDQKLHYISFEKYPLAASEISMALARWDFGGRLEKLCAVYPVRVPGFHRVIVTDRIILTLVFDDVNHAIPELDVPCGINAWFLDGFAPAKNPDMWSETLFENMARLSAPGATFATFTAAGFVKRGLEAAGFSVEKRKGYGRKRDMLAGHIGKAPVPVSVLQPPQRIAVIGGGLAGTAAAWVLKRYGLDVVVFEQEKTLATGASGNETGLFNPRFSQYRTADSDFFVAAWAQAVRTWPLLPHIDWQPCGSLHLSVDGEKDKKLRGALDHWGWHADHMTWIAPHEASACAGVALHRGALFLPDAGTVSPRRLCGEYVRDVDVRLGSAPSDLSAFDAVILACGAGVRAYEEDLPLHTVRGQVTYVEATATTAGLRTNLCYGGYATPARQGVHTIGATFQQWLTGTDRRPEDDEDNLRRLQEILPHLENPRIGDGRASLRVSSKDRMPVIGHVRDNIYVSTAHGSHGLVSSLAAAHLLADMLTGGPASLPRSTRVRIAPDRFRLRKEIKKDGNKRIAEAARD